MARRSPAAQSAEAPVKAASSFKFPKSFGGCADKLYQLREKRREAQKVVDAIQAEENALKEHVIQTMSKEDTGALGKIAKVTLVPKDIPQVKDYDQFYAYISKKNSP